MLTSRFIKTRLNARFLLVYLQPQKLLCIEELLQMDRSGNNVGIVPGTSFMIVSKTGLILDGGK